MRISRRITSRVVIIFVVCIFLVIVCNLLLLAVHNTDQKQRDKPPKPARETKQTLTPTAIVTTTAAAALHANVFSQKSLKIDKTTLIIHQLQSRWKDPQFPWTNLNNTWTINEQNLSRVLIAGRLNFNGAEVKLPAAKIWDLAGNWVRPPRQIFPRQTPGLDSVLRNLANETIIKAGIGLRGTQLKLTLQLNGGQKVLFKPMRYPRNEIFTDTPYSGADRHNGEIAAFHLSRLLDLRWCPLVSGRKVDLEREILPVAEEGLRKTFFTKNNDTCFYGVCYYCNPNDPVCANGTVLEGAVILWLPTKHKLKVHRHPWARTYKEKTVATWEKNDDYCEKIKKIHPFHEVRRLLDVIDVAVFDFLTGNADRHRYETFESLADSVILLMDNGKSFGNPYHDELTILAPLYQCCKIRSSTVEVLTSFRDRSLSFSLQTLLKTDPLYPILNDEHLLALDRRRMKILNVVDWCLERHDSTIVFEIGI